VLPGKYNEAELKWRRACAPGYALGEALGTARVSHRGKERKRIARGMKPYRFSAVGLPQ
jgi:hypothetical protein